MNKIVNGNRGEERESSFSFPIFHPLSASTLKDPQRHETKAKAIDNARAGRMRAIHLSERERERETMQSRHPIGGLDGTVSATLTYPLSLTHTTTVETVKFHLISRLPLSPQITSTRKSAERVLYGRVLPLGK